MMYNLKPILNAIYYILLTTRYAAFTSNSKSIILML